MQVIINEALPSIANKRYNWKKQYSIFKRFHNLGYWAGIDLKSFHEKVKEPVTIRLIRHGPRKLDFDNLIYAFKPLRDGIAEALWPEKSLRTRDDHDGVKWEYDQEKNLLRYISVQLYSADISKGQEDGKKNRKNNRA